MTAPHGGGPPQPRTLFRHRIPKSVRQHWKLVVALAAVLAVLGGVFGSVSIRPYITGDATVIASPITDNITGTVDLFDTSVDHELSIDMTDAEYDDMITSFQSTGEKKWVNATVTIDGTVVTDVAVRLKGNSTLMGVRGDGAGPGGEGFQPPEGMELPEGFDPAAMGEGMGGMGTVSQASADDPTSLPLLLSFDENADGRAYQGMTEISVRPGSPVLNEAMALSLTDATDQPTQQYAYAVYSINGGTTATRLLLAHPDDTYANELFDSDGYLYKADASSRFEYVGRDQSDYSEQFKQINAADSGNLQPIVNFLEWMDSASDEEFEQHLGDWVDVESFAKYLATQNLIVNGDDMAGPGQNYYLWYDLETEKLSVVSWDLNMAMQGDATTGPDEAVSMGPGAMVGGMGGGHQAGLQPPANGMGPGGVRPPHSGAMPEGGTGDGGGGDPQGGERTMGGNELKTRFLASDELHKIYDEQYWTLYDQMYGSGTASEILGDLAETVPTSDGLTEEDLRSTVDTMQSWIDQRRTALDAARDR